MKKLLLILLMSAFTFSCGNSEDSLVKKKITQKIDSDSMGMIKDLNVEKVEKINDSVFTGIHSFTNPLIDKKVRITREYTFTEDFQSILDSEDTKFEIMSEGEWIESSAGF